MPLSASATEPEGQTQSAIYLPPFTECFHDRDELAPDGFDFVIEGDGMFMLSPEAMSAVLKDKVKHAADLEALSECEARECEKARVSKSTDVLTNPLFWGVVIPLVAGAITGPILAYELTKPGS